MRRVCKNLFGTSLSLALGQPLAAASLAKLSHRTHKTCARESLSTEARDGPSEALTHPSLQKIIAEEE